MKGKKKEQSIIEESHAEMPAVAGQVSPDAPKIKVPKVKPDHGSKKFFKQPGVYTDTVNTYFYDGEQAIDPGSVRFTSEELVSMRKEEGRLDSALRICDVSAHVELFGMEAITHLEIQNQKTDIMPTREINYAGLRYDAMEGKTLPVINYTLYTGNGTWDKAERLSDMFGQPMPEKMKKDFNDFDIHIRDIKEGNSEHAKTKELKDFIDLVNAFKSKRMPDCGRKYDKKAAICAASLSSWNDKILEFIENQEGDEVDMWDGVRELMDEWKAEGEAKGRAEGVAEGEAKGKTLGESHGKMIRSLEIARNLLRMAILDDSQIISATGLTIEQLNELKME